VSTGSKRRDNASESFNASHNCNLALYRRSIGGDTLGSNLLPAPQLTPSCRCDRQNNQNLIIGNQRSPQWERQGGVICVMLGCIMQLPIAASAGVTRV